MAPANGFIMTKTVLIDLTMLKQPNSGFGSVTSAFAKGIVESGIKDMHFQLLMPPGHTMPVPDNMSLITANTWKKHFTRALPKAAVWHSTYQHFKFLRLTSETRQIITIHDLNFLYEKKPHRAKHYLNLMQKRIDRAAAIVAISSFVADEIRQHLNVKSKHLEVIYNAVSDLSEAPDQCPTFIRSEQKPFFFSIGAIRPKKNFHVLLDLMKRFPDMDLYICGNMDDTTYVSHLRERITNEGITNAYLPGNISEIEKVWLYRHCSAFLFPSKFEGFGLPVIEAMHFGKPVFSSPLTSLEEVCGGHAFMWQDFNTDHMEQIIRENLPAFGVDKEKVAAMKRYAASFSLDININAYLSLYRKLF